MKLNFELFDYIHDGICIIDSKYKIVYCNNSLEHYTGIDRNDLLNECLTAKFPILDHPRYRLRIDLLFSEGMPILISTQLNKNIFTDNEDNSEKVQEIIVSRIPSETEGEYYAVFNVKDITELSGRINALREKHNMLVEEIEQREILESKLRRSLDEKEILIKEVHHRVKNNLALIGSLINMQTRQIGEDRVVAILNDLKKRVAAISLIHENLYKSKDLVSISSKAYLNELLDNIKDSLISKTNQISITTKIADISLDVETTIPLGLIVTEIITNSLKYAFSDNENGDILVELTKDQDWCRLLISDTGPGFPKDFQKKNSESLGLLLIDSLASQLHGNHEMKNNNGAVHILNFPQQ